MKKDNVVLNKSFAFAVRIVKLYKFLCEQMNEYTLSKQLLRSVTSIGANIEEAVGAQSEKDFYVKLCIAYKETRETHYWIRLLSDTEYLTENQKNINTKRLRRTIKNHRKHTKKHKSKTS